MKALFHGVIAEELVHPFPHTSRDERENVEQILAATRAFAAAHIDAAAIDREGRIGDDVLRGLADLGLFGLAVPREHGGIGLSSLAYVRVIEELASLDASVALTVGAHQSIGIEGLVRFGTPEQQRLYLPSLARGERIAAFALSEAGAGSDASALKTQATLLPGGEAYSLTGSKMWVTNGGLASLFTVFARTSSADEGHKPRITAFLVEPGEGVEVGPNADKLGVRGASTTQIVLRDARVPVGNVLGAVGRGFPIALEVLNAGRLGLAAGCVGAAKRLVKMACERVQQRKAFGRAIGEFGLVKDKIASMMASTFAIESMTYLTAGLADARADFALESAIAKIAASEALFQIANDTLQLAAGIGYMRAHPYERMLRDARIHGIFQGTSDILRCFVALAGMQGPARELADVGRAIREPLKSFGLLGDFAVRRARTALGRERMSRAHPLLNREAVVFEEYTVELAKAVDKVLRKHGNEIAEMQYTQRRVAEVAIDLFGIGACIARTTRAIERRGVEGARREIDLTTMFVAAAERRLAAEVRSFDKNDDELRKAIAARAYVDGGYPFDAV